MYFNTTRNFPQLMGLGYAFDHPPYARNLSRFATYPYLSNRMVGETSGVFRPNTAQQGPIRRTGTNQMAMLRGFGEAGPLDPLVPQPGTWGFRNTRPLSVEEQQIVFSMVPLMSPDGFFYRVANGSSGDPDIWTELRKDNSINFLIFDDATGSIQSVSPFNMILRDRDAEGKLPLKLLAHPGNRAFTKEALSEYKNSLTLKDWGAPGGVALSSASKSSIPVVPILVGVAVVGALYFATKK